ncbi:MAG TPA: acyl carrier protein [Bryobacteraceae bacterium]|jgi:acyl carrier protein|nr:acyl carrier protein [Bryobacteraceae bacterium]
MTRIEQALKAIRPEYDFTSSVNFIEDGMLDSYDMVMLVADIDKTYGITLAGVDIVPENFASIQAIEALLARYGVQS